MHNLSCLWEMTNFNQLDILISLSWCNGQSFWCRPFTQGLEPPAAADERGVAAAGHGAGRPGRHFHPCTALLSLRHAPPSLSHSQPFPARLAPSHTCTRAFWFAPGLPVLTCLDGFPSCSSFKAVIPVPTNSTHVGRVES